MKKALLSICLLTLVFILFGCSNNANKIKFSKTETSNIKIKDSSIEFTEEQAESLFKIIDSLEWLKEKEDNDKVPSFDLNIYAYRTISKDDNNLMLDSVGSQVILYYYVDLNTGTVMMGYVTLSSIINNLYAKLSIKQLNKIRTLFNLID
ncbi:MAG: hypothetical protein M0R05_03640 [Bacilli bacterium]|nr:hypothetical protein [Bacilli bacterium]MDD4076847.1 hypothetical protein [Bacilli bacterium]MDD4388152.1 hypothetical protein [Bacilli bacterium]